MHLERLSQAERMLAEIASAKDALDIIDYAEAARVFAKEARLGTAAINHATVVKLRAERRLADVVDEGQRRGEIASMGSNQHRLEGIRPPNTLESLGIKPPRLAEARQLRDAFTDADLERLAREKSERDEEMSRKRLLRMAREKDAAGRNTEAAHTLKSPPRIDLVHSDLSALEFPQAFDLIFTDPPYPAEFLPEWEKLARFAALSLKPGALLVAYSGQYHLPEVMYALECELEYVWMGALVTPGAHNQVQQRHVRSAAKPLLFYSAGEYQPGPWFDDAYVSEERAKTDHIWQQSLGAAKYFIERLTAPGDLVCDPFLGSGTTAVACKELGRRFIGCDIDVAAIGAAKLRLAA